MSDAFDKNIAAALDLYTVPALSADFADRVIQTVTAAPALAKPPSRDRRGRWSRLRNASIGIGAFGVMSAAAAATGAFGDIAKDVPVIGPLIESIAPTKPKAVRFAARKPRPAAKPIEPATIKVAEPPIAVSAATQDDEMLREERRARREARLNARVERLQARRVDAGLLPLAPERAVRRARIADRQARLRKEWDALSSEDRTALQTRVDERMQRNQAQEEGGFITRRRAIIQELRARRNARVADAPTTAP